MDGKDSFKKSMDSCQDLINILSPLTFDEHPLTFLDEEDKIKLIDALLVLESNLKNAVLYVLNGYVNELETSISCYVERKKAYMEKLELLSLKESK